MKITYIKLITIIFGVYLLSACSKPASTPEMDVDVQTEENRVELTAAQMAQAQISIGKVTKSRMSTQLNVNGTIELPPQSNISITIPYGGFIKNTSLLPGSKVKKGQLLVEIENPEFIQFQQDYLIAKANNEFLKEEFERQGSLLEGGAAANKRMQEAKANFLSNEAKLNGLSEKLKLIGIDVKNLSSNNISPRTKIYSKIDGSVRDVFVNIGRYVQPQDVIMDLTNDEDLHVELSVYENDIHSISKDQIITFTLINDPDKIRLAKVFLVGTNVREDRSVTVHGHLTEKYDDILPGMYVVAKIEGGKQEVMAVSDKAVVRFAGKHYVFALEGKDTSSSNSIFQMIEVELGIKTNDLVEVKLIEEGLEMTEMDIVIEGASTLFAAMKNIEEEE
jgi:membrane fusion protein, heavy metal efflux system